MNKNNEIEIMSLSVHCLSFYFSVFRIALSKTKSLLGVHLCTTPVSRIGH